MNDQALAEKAAGGCWASFAALIDRHYDRIYQLAWRICGPRAQAEDIAQDVCVKLATAKAGIQRVQQLSWMPAYAGMTIFADFQTCLADVKAVSRECRRRHRR